jgi:hypothetical protein
MSIRESGEMARIAIVDDNADIGEVLGLVLLGCHEVELFSDGESFLERRNESV